jgi:hypothetical protein
MDIVKQRDIRRLKTVEMKFMRSRAGYSPVNHRRNEDISVELKVDPAENKILQYKQNCLIMLAGWKTLDTPNNCLPIDLSE